LATPQTIFEHYHNYIEQWPEQFRTQTEEFAEVSCSCLADKINDFTDILDSLPHHQVVTRSKRFLDHVALCMPMAALTLASYSSARILKLETQIDTSSKKLDHLVDITNLHEQHFKAMDQKLDDVSDKLATILKINKVHFAKMTDFMKQKFGTVISICECLIHTAYNHRLSPGEAMLEMVRYIMKSQTKVKCSSLFTSHQTSSSWKLPTFTSLAKTHLLLCSTGLSPQSDATL
jgi:hypothetical protein